jgi:Galactose oxidase, central domain
MKRFSNSLPVDARSLFRSGRRLFLLSLTTLTLAACGGGGDGDDPPSGGNPPAAPQIGSFSADRAQYFLGDTPQLTATFSGGSGRILFVDRPTESLAISSGQAVAIPAVTRSSEVKLVVESASAQRVERTLAIPVTLRGRYTALAQPLSVTGHAAVALSNGNALVVGGSRGEGVLSNAIDRFNRQLQRFERVGQMATGREGHILARLPDGNLLSIGGQFSLSGAAQNELINTTNWTTSPGAPMSTRRIEHAALALADGRVLVTGGVTTEGLRDAVSFTAEIYDPTTRSFRRLNNRMVTPRATHEMHLLRSGKVLIVGGFSYVGIGAEYAFAELFDPATESFSIVTSPIASPRALFASGVASDGALLFAGGEAADGALTDEVLRYDPVANRIERVTAKLPTPTTLAQSALLPDGRMGLFGGQSRSEPLGAVSALALGGAPISVATLPALPDARVWHRTIRLTDGRIMIVGGAIGAAFRQTVYLLD